MADMDKDRVIETLRRHEAALHARGVTHAALFGSVARGDNRPDSDVDIMIEVDTGRISGVFAYAEIISYINSLFPCKVDVSNKKKLHPYVRPSALKESVYAF
jgi:predicted nucleotidyltransferase